jgi:hypothetical protein
MAKKTFKTGEVIVQSGIYGTPSKKTPEITLSKGDKVPPVGGKSVPVTLKRPVRKG